MTRPEIVTEQALRIGDVAAQTGVTVEALRYYERRGLLRAAGRRTSGYREFPSDAVRVVRFIKRAQSLGFSLSEVEELVRLHERAWTGDAPRQLRDAAVTKVRDIDRRVRELRALRSELAALITACDSGCPVGDAPARNANGQSAESQSNDPLSCPLVEAFDADVSSGEGKSHNVSQQQRTRASRGKSRNGSPKPGRRISQK